MSDTSVKCEIEFWALVQKPQTNSQRDRLVDIAHSLRQKFFCTYDERSNSLVCKPHDPKDWTLDDFRLYAAEHIIYALSKELNCA